MKLSEREKAIQKYILKIGVFGFVGAGLGFAYYYFIGCNAGSCPITSNPYISSAYGLIMGILFGAGSRSKSRKCENADTPPY